MQLFEELKANYYKKGTKQVEPIKVIISISVFLMLILFAIYKTNDIAKKKKERKENAKYTIGVTGKIYKNPKSSKPTIKYTYAYKLKEYNDREHVDAKFEDIVAEKKRYYVEFSYNHPENSKLLLMYPVPDSVQIAPDDGWDYMPGYKK
jgi:hypothetical protein